VHTHLYKFIDVFLGLITINYKPIQKNLVCFSML